MQTAVEARTRRDTGMALSEDKANRQQPGWSEAALVVVEKYCLAHPDRQFLTEEVRTWAEQLGLIDAPENTKSWGSVMRRAASFGEIRWVGYAPAISSNLSPKVLWQGVA